jgi:glycerol-3-phosphate acyltransferase PlsX
MVRDRLMATARGKLGGWLIRPAMRRFVRDISSSETGGALLVGIDGIVIIAHGKSDGRAIKNAIKAAARFADAGLVGHLGEAIARHGEVWRAAGEPPPAAAEGAS